MAKKETEKDKIVRVLENLKNGKRMNREEMIHLLENYKYICDKVERASHGLDDWLDVLAEIGYFELDDECEEGCETK